MLASLGATLGLLMLPVALVLNILALCLKQPLRLAVPGIILSGIPVLLIIVRLAAVLAAAFAEAWQLLMTP